MTKSTNAIDKEVIEKFFDKYLPVVEDAIEQETISTQDIKVLVGSFLGLLKRKDPLSKQIVEVSFDHFPSLGEKTFHN